MSHFVKIRFVTGWLLLSFCCLNHPVAAQKQKAADHKIEILARFALPEEPPASCTVQSTTEDGTITLKYEGKLSEGYFLAAMRQNDEGRVSGDRFNLFRFKVKQINANNIAVIASTKKVATFLGKGDIMGLFRPENTSTAFMKKLPEKIELKLAEQSNARKTSKENIKQLAIAIHNYHEAFNRFPPAVIKGPDGKPWHSWRVMILPFIGEIDLYRQYNRNEPWNSPNNKKLLSKMPDIFRNPAYPNQEKFYTNYAAVSGDGTAFPPNTASYKKDANGKLTLEYHNKIRFRDIADGTSNTIMFGTVSPDQKIPWMKPDDLPLGKEVSKLGSKNSFATPFTIGTIPHAMVVWCDGSTSLLPKSTKTSTLKNMLRRNDGNIIQRGETGIRPSGRTPEMEIYRDKDGVKAKLLFVNPQGKIVKPQLAIPVKKIPFKLEIPKIKSGDKS